MMKRCKVCVYYLKGGSEFPYMGRCFANPPTIQPAMRAMGEDAADDWESARPLVCENNPACRFWEKQNELV